MTLGRTAALIGVAVMAIGLAALPVVVALGPAPGAGAWLAAGAGSLVAVVGGVKLAAMAWGIATRLATRRMPQVAAASTD